MYWICIKFSDFKWIYLLKNCMVDCLRYHIVEIPQRSRWHRQLTKIDTIDPKLYHRLQFKVKEECGRLMRKENNCNQNWDSEEWSIPSQSQHRLEGPHDTCSHAPWLPLPGWLLCYLRFPRWPHHPHVEPQTSAPALQNIYKMFSINQAHSILKWCSEWSS